MIQRANTATATSTSMVLIVAVTLIGFSTLSFAPDADAFYSETGPARVPVPTQDASVAPARISGTGSAYVFGGYGPDGLLDQIVRYTPSTEKVSLMPETLPTARTGTAAFWDGTYAYIIGGYDAGDRLDEIVRYDPATGQVTVLAAKLPWRLGDAEAVWDGTHAYIIGGYGGSNADQEIIRFTPSTGAVSVLGIDLPGWRRYHAVALDDFGEDRIYVFGGQNVGVAGLRDDIVEINLATNQVTTMNAQLPEGIRDASAVFGGGVVFVFGGYYSSAGSSDTILEYLGFADTLNTVTSTLPSPRYNSVAFWSGLFDAHIIGGVDPHFINDPDEGFILVDQTDEIVLFRNAPSYPENLRTTTGPDRGEITLQWDPVIDNGHNGFPDKFRILRGTTPATLTPLADTLGYTLTYVDSGNGDNELYYYQVLAMEGVVEGQKSDVRTGATMTLPWAPLDLDASPGPGIGEITVTWDRPTFDGRSDSLTYRVYRLVPTDPDPEFVHVASVADDETWLDDGHPNGSRFYYYVTATNPVGEGASSSSDSARTFSAPSAPSIQATSGPNPNEITVTWAPPFDGGTPITAYRLHRGTTSGSTEFLAELASGQTSYTDSGIPDGAFRYYRLSALNLVGAGSLSAEVKGRTYTIPSEPVALASESGPGLQEITLSWDPPLDTGEAPIQGYRVYRGTSPGGLAFVAQVPGNQHSFNDSGLSLLETYHYEVTATNLMGEGPASNQVSDEPFPVPFPLP